METQDSSPASRRCPPSSAPQGSDPNPPSQESTPHILPYPQPHSPLPSCIPSLPQIRRNKQAKVIFFLPLIAKYISIAVIQSIINSSSASQNTVQVAYREPLVPGPGHIARHSGCQAVLCSCASPLPQQGKEQRWLLAPKRRLAQRYCEESARSPEAAEHVGFLMLVRCPSTHLHSEGGELKWFRFPSADGLIHVTHPISY